MTGPCQSPHSLTRASQRCKAGGGGFRGYCTGGGAWLITYWITGGGASTARYSTCGGAWRLANWTSSSSWRTRSESACTSACFAASRDTAGGALAWMTLVTCALSGGARLLTLTAPDASTHV